MSDTTIVNRMRCKLAALALVDLALAAVVLVTIDSTIGTAVTRPRLPHRQERR